MAAEDQRQSANYKPTSWSYKFVQSLKIIDYSNEKYKKRVKKLEEEVRFVINSTESASNLLSILQLVDDIKRLGLAYRFEKDIKRVLDVINSSSVEYFDLKLEKQLHATALRFRLLRQHGYEVSQDVFKTFMDQEDNFIACHGKDVIGMLSLYEASYLAFEEEHLLEKALIFSRTHLNKLKEKLNPTMTEIVSHSLELPLHHRVVRLEARWYIDVYNKRKDANYFLLELAKLDFNMVQSIHQTDLQDMSRWWERIGLANKLNFARDRLVECFFGTVGMVPEPQFSGCRQVLTKIGAFITIVDDIYDAYGTLDELELFTNVIQRWDVNGVNDLPAYMKLCFLALYNTINEMSYDVLKENGQNIIPYLKEAWADLCNAFLQEAKWCYNKYTPTFEEYLDNAWKSVSGSLILVHSYFLLNESITKEALESLEKQYKLLRWTSLIFRICNDLGTSKAELERGEITSSMHCYMSETGLSEKVAHGHMRDIIDKTWKKMNKEWVENRPFGEPFVETAINLARMSHCIYQHGDGHGAPDVKAKKNIMSLLIKPNSLMERNQDPLLS